MNINPNKKMGVAFFDIGGNNLTKLMYQHSDVFGISQLPYYQAALPVFLMYLRVIISYKKVFNY
jgi:hypothetical protein